MFGDDPYTLNSLDESGMAEEVAITLETAWDVLHRRTEHPLTFVSYFMDDAPDVFVTGDGEPGERHDARRPSGE